MLGPTRPTGRTRSNLRLASRHLLCCLRKSGSLHSVPTSIPHPAMDDATATAFFLLPIPSEGSNSKQDKALWPLRILCFKVGFPFLSSGPLLAIRPRYCAILRIVQYLRCHFLYGALTPHSCCPSFSPSPLTSTRMSNDDAHVSANTPVLTNGTGQNFPQHLSSYAAQCNVQYIGHRGPVCV